MATVELSQFNNTDGYNISNNSSDGRENGFRGNLVTIEITSIAVPIYGYVSPVLIFFTLITNVLICIVLMRRNMRSPTNYMLVAMAVSDMLTGIWSVPCFIYFYAMGNYGEPVPYDWCAVYFALSHYLPTIFHTASIWLTMGLAIQRYIYVCASIKAKHWCTVPNVMKVILFIYSISVLTHVCRFFDSIYEPVIWDSQLRPNTTMVACSSRYISLVEHFIGLDVYFGLYLWCRVIFIHFIPCTSLVVLNALLIYAMRSAQERRKKLLTQNRTSECKKLKESNTTTLMLVVVVGVFLLVELPMGILLIIYIIENTIEIELIGHYEFNMASQLINLLIMFSYPINFFIYCGMSRQFRQTFKRLFVPGFSAYETEHSQYMSLADRNGTTTRTTAL